MRAKEVDMVFLPASLPYVHTSISSDTDAATDGGPAGGPPAWQKPIRGTSVVSHRHGTVHVGTQE